ncbi:MAG: alpha/beta hydrolase, partial [Desulfamplus sp.]|nr:alpha/beta hydrolase [Desulfamplus sp.]
YDVMSMDWRGQGLSVRELPNRDMGYVKDFELYINDLELFYNRYVVPLKQPVTIMAHSMGGHIALRFLAQCSDRINIPKAILIAPMLDIVTAPIPRTISSIMASLAVRIGFGLNYVLGGKDYCRETVQFENNLLTHDIDNFWFEHKEIEKNRNLALGGVSWWWLKVAFDSIDIIKNKEYLSNIKTKIQIFSAEEDRIVCNDVQKQVCPMIPDGTLISIPGSRHEILFETHDIKTVLWNHISNFLK